MKKYALILILGAMFATGLSVTFFVFHAMEPTPKERRLIAVERVERTEFDAQGNAVSVKQLRRKIFKRVPISGGAQ